MFELRCSKFELFCSESASQPPGSGPGGRGFKFPLPDQLFQQLVNGLGGFKKPTVVKIVDTPILLRNSRSLPVSRIDCGLARVGNLSKTPI
jgi:hypothetical protein